MPDPREDETREAFMSRCMGHSEARESFPRGDQRAAFCHSQWDRRHNMKIASILLSNVTTRMETFEGKEHLVVPVIALVEGVLNDFYYPGSEIAKHPGSWNGVPVVIEHPVDSQGTSVSANTPPVLEKVRVGHFFNVGSDGVKLKGEAWINIEKAKEIRPGILKEVHQNLEVSTGLFGDSNNVPGTWEGIDFGSTLTGFRPDHLALLFEGEGACNWQDGCGVRVNMQEEGGDKMADKDVMMEEALKAAGVEGEKKVGVFKKMLNSFLSSFKANELGHDDIRMQLQEIVDAMDVPTEQVSPVLHYVQEVFDDYVIMRQTSGSTSKLFRIGFDVSDDRVVLKSDRVEVREETDFVPAEVGLGSQITYVEVNSKKEDLKMAKKKDECCKELIDALIANEATQFAEEDRVWLDELPEDQIKRLSPVEKKADDDDAKVKAAAEKAEATRIAEVAKKAFNEAINPDDKTLSDDDKKKGELDEPVTTEAYIKNAPDEIQDVLSEGLAMHKAKKTQLIDGLIANKRNKFTKEQLEAKKVGELEMLADLAAVVVDFSVNSPKITNAEDDEEIPTAPEIDWKAAADQKK